MLRRVRQFSRELNATCVLAVTLAVGARAGFAQVVVPKGFEQFEELGEDFFQQMFGETEKDRRLLASVEVSRREEMRYGKTLLHAFLDSLRKQNLEISKRGTDVAYLRALVEELRPCIRHANRYRSIDVYIAKTEITDARTFAGGSIVVTTGFLEFAHTEAAVVGTLGHELSHLDRGHVIDPIRRYKLARGTLSEKNVTGREFMTRGKLFIGQFVRPFRPEQESEADMDAARWMLQVGYDPLELASLFLRLHNRGNDRRPPLPSFFRSHPFHMDRFKAIQEFAKGQTRQGLYVGKVNLRRRIPKSEKRFPE